jgi:hypothetical protein
VGIPCGPAADASLSPQENCGADSGGLFGMERRHLIVLLPILLLSLPASLPARIDIASGPFISVQAAFRF